MVSTAKSKHGCGEGKACAPYYGTGWEEKDGMNAGWHSVKCLRLRGGDVKY